MFTLSVQTRCCQTEAGSKDCSHSKMGTSVEFIITQSVVQQARGDQICMAAINSPRGPHVLPQTVRKDHMFCHGQSVGGPLLGWTS